LCLGDSALHGIAGDFVRMLDAYTEADPAAVLLQLLVGFGNAIGRGPYFVADGARHYTNLFATLTGPTSKGRKGSSWARVLEALKLVDPDWAARCMATGLSSGEGVTYAVRDGAEHGDDQGVADKRVLVQEAEFAATLRVLRREGNTLSPVLRCAWDTGELRSMTRGSPMRATGAHISIVAHVTADELRSTLNQTEIGNGFANRFLWVWVERSKCLPDAPCVPARDLQALGERLRCAYQFAQGIREMKRDRQARALWYAQYRRLSDGKPGMFGALTARAEAQVTRLSVLYALLDCSPEIRVEHLQAALELWQYCEESVRRVFGESLGDSFADEILAALQETAAGLTRTDIFSLFGRHPKRVVIDRALRHLVDLRLARCERHETAGRTAEIWYATEAQGGTVSATEDRAEV
jgi:hypothetical protein